MRDNTFVKEGMIKIRGKNRVLYKKANSKSDNPILFVKTTDGFVNYKAYIKKQNALQMKGGTTDIKNFKNYEYVEKSIDPIFDHISHTMYYDKSKDDLSNNYFNHPQPFYIETRNDENIQDVVQALKKYIVVKHDYNMIETKYDNQNDVTMTIKDHPYRSRKSIFRSRISAIRRYDKKPVVEMTIRWKDKNKFIAYIGLKNQKL